MSVRSTGADDGGAGKVIGVRTRGSDKVRWAIWTGDQRIEPCQLVRLTDTGQLGTLVAAPGMVVGVGEIDSLPRVSAVDDDAQTPDDVPQLPAKSAWGRIGHRNNLSRNADTGSIASPASARYLILKSDMPVLGSHIETEHGGGAVIASDVFAGTLTVRLDASSDVVKVQHRPPALTGTTNASPSNMREHPNA